MLMGVPRSPSGWSAYAGVAGPQVGSDRLQRQPRTSPVRAVKRREGWLRSVLLGTTTGLASIHAAARAERIHIDFNGYRPATNDYCIEALAEPGLCFSPS